MSDPTDTLNDRLTIQKLAEIGVNLDPDQLEPAEDRGYVQWEHPDRNKSKQRTSWRGPLEKESVMPYYCPAGWRRFALKTDFEPGFWESSSHMYHGTRPCQVESILQSGFRPSRCQHGSSAVYMTPSIRYAAHPRYAGIVEKGGEYFQVVLEVRVLNDLIKHWTEAFEAMSPRDGHMTTDTGAHIGVAGETMCVYKHCRIDNNFENECMEFLCFSDLEHYVTPEDGMIVTGIMVRSLKVNPIGHEKNHWWVHWAKRMSGCDKDEPALEWLMENYCH